MPSFREQRRLDAGPTSARGTKGPGALALALAISFAWGSPARAQQQAGGFAVERFYPSAAGGGWFVMDALDMRGNLGGAFAVSAGYSRSPLRIRGEGDAQSLRVVADQAFAAVGAAITYDRFRLYFDVTKPLSVGGESGPVGDYAFTAPSTSVAKAPDALSDVRVGFDTRVLGDALSSFRLGVGAQLLIPSGDRADYVTDDTYRAMGRLLFAGDVGFLTYAGQLGLHIRPLDGAATPGSPRQHELLFGVAAGARAPIGNDTVFVVGPEVFGERALRSLFGTTATGVQGLLTGRVEHAADDGPLLRFKVGGGGGIRASLGAPELRVVFGVEITDHRR